MYCPNCGHDNLDTAAHCAACGTALAASAAPPPPPPAYGGAPAYNQNAYGAGPTGAKPQNHMVFAILSAILGFVFNILGCCCLPATLVTGIVAIVYATKVDKLWAAGDENGANEASGKAKLWSIVTASLGAIFLLLFILSLVLQSAGYMDENFWREFQQQMEAQG